jgi:hypothetical protein
LIFSQSRDSTPGWFGSPNFFAAMPRESTPAHTERP